MQGAVVEAVHGISCFSGLDLGSEHNHLLAIIKYFFKLVSWEDERHSILAPCYGVLAYSDKNTICGRSTAKAGRLRSTVRYMRIKTFGRTRT